MVGGKRRAARRGGGGKAARKNTGVRARAYCSSANLGPGFDVFGVALDAFYDEVTVSVPRSNANSGSITITNTGIGNNAKARGRKAMTPPPPTDPDANTAGLVAKSMLRGHGITDDITIAIRKGVPTGLGLGSSAASAAAAAVACDSLFGLGLAPAELVSAAGEGERASAGTVHYDNVAASVMGGFVVVRPGSPMALAGFRPSPRLRFCVAIPTIRVPDKKTAVSRGVLPRKVSLGDSASNTANAALLAVSLATGDNSMLGSGITADTIAEPARKHMIPGFDRVKEAALGAGAKEVMISGAGPSVISITTGAPKTQQKITAAMSAGFRSAGVPCRTVVCRPAGGARIVP